MENNCLLYKMGKPNECNALSDEAYREALRHQECGTPLCPFYKTEEQQIAQENACRKRLAKKGLGYVGIITGDGIIR